MGHLITSREDFQAAIDVLRQTTGPLVVDTETTGLAMFAAKDPARMCSIQIGPLNAENTDHDYYFSFRHAEGPNLPLELLQPLRELLRLRTWVCHNASFDIKILYCDGFAIPLKVIDTIGEAHLCNENRRSFALKELCYSIFGAEAVKDDTALKELLRSRKLGKGDVSKLSAAELCDYGLADIDLTRRLHKVLEPELALWRLSDLSGEVMEFLLALIRVEIRGVRLDQDEVHRQLAAIGPLIEEYRNELITLSGMPDLNLNSPAQLKQWLKLPATDKQTLDDILIRDQRHDIRVLLEYRALAKAESTYFRPFLELADTASRIHTNYKIHGTVTGRLSSSEPNLQNASREGTVMRGGVRQERGYSVRRCFVTNPGWNLFEFDYSAVEPRIAAHYSKDPTMIGAFLQGHDFHSAVAKSMFKKSDISSEERTSAKTLGLGVLYGMGAFKSAVKLNLRHRQLEDGTLEYHDELVWGLHQETGELTQFPCSGMNAEFCTHAGRGYIKQFYEGLPELEPTIKAVRHVAAKNGYIRNPVTGRCSRFEGHRHPHKAFNSLIQQTAAEILRRALTKLDKTFTRQDDPQMVQTVHDSIAIEIPEGPREQEHVKAILEIMEGSTTLDVPLKVDVKCGKSLGTLIGVPRA